MEGAVGSAHDGRVAHQLVLTHLRLQQRPVAMEDAPFQAIVTGGEIQAVLAVVAKEREKEGIFGEGGRSQNEQQCEAHVL